MRGDVKECDGNGKGREEEGAGHCRRGREVGGDEIR